MPAFRYPQFCAIARAAEVLGERWNLLLIRQLFLGPQRFSDLRRQLSGVSPSVLTERLVSLERHGVLARTRITRPVPGVVYELTPRGRALGPAFLELARWGASFLLPVRSGETLDPEAFRWLMAQSTSAVSKRDICIELRMRNDDEVHVIHVDALTTGTVVTAASAAADVVVTGESLAVVGVVAGELEAKEAAAAGLVVIEGDAGLLRQLPTLFSLGLSLPTENASNLESDGE